MAQLLVVSRDLGGGPPTGPAGGDLGGNYPNPTVVAVEETSGPTRLAMGAVPDGDYLTRSGATVVGVPLQQTSSIANPGPAINANTNAKALALLPYALFEPTAERTIDVPGTGGTAWDTTKSAILTIYKDTRSLFGIVINVTTNGGGLWTTPAGLNQDYFLPGSSEALTGGWILIIDGPNKTVRCIQMSRGVPDVMTIAPTASPGDTLDLTAAGGTASVSVNGSYQIGAPRADGVAFIANALLNTKRLQSRDGITTRLLMEPTVVNPIFQSETLYTGAAITAPWVAIGGTTGLGGQAGSPRGDATVTNLIFTASAADGIRQPYTGVQVADFPMTHSIWVKVAAGTGKCRLQILFKDGTTLTSADFNLTTTWQRISLTCPNIGPFGSAGTPEFRILNGTDAAARTIQVWGAQAEASLEPTSYIRTVAAAVTRTGDTLYYGVGAYPASFRTRGVSVPLVPLNSSDNLYNTSASVSALVSFDGDGTYFRPAAAFNDYLSIMGFRVTSLVSSGRAARIGLSAQVDDAPGSGGPNGLPGSPRIYGEPLHFNNGDVLTIDGEIYRGAIRIQGATSGNGRFVLGLGAMTWPTGGSLFIGGFSSGTASPTFPFEIGPILTAA